MRESTGNALLMTTMTSVIAIVLSFLVGSISYSKSYRVKSYIIDEIEQQKKYKESVYNDGGLNSDLDERIAEHLMSVGYRVGNHDCPNLSNYSQITLNYSKDYDICIYHSNEGESYAVVTFMQFDFPVIKQIVSFQIKGETKNYY